jgi:hypothetical protein
MRQDRSGTTFDVGGAGQPRSASFRLAPPPVKDLRYSALSVTRQKSGGHPERRTLWTTRITGGTPVPRPGSRAGRPCHHGRQPGPEMIFPWS